MTDEVTPRLLRRCARACAWPAVTYGHTTIADQGAWQWAVDNSSPAERVQLIVALGPFLLAASDGGKSRLAAQQYRAGDFDDEPYVVGDKAAVPLVKAALALAPPVVRFAIQREVAFLSVGASCAWTSAAAFVDVTGWRKTTVIVLGPGMTILLVLHEMGHAFCRPNPNEEWCAITVQGEEGLRTLMSEAGNDALVRRFEREAEAVADGLALSWWYAEPEKRARPA